jgi:hypothetical protein
LFQAINHLRFSRRTVNFYLLGVILLGLLHHTDHALRYDHSGWPLRGDTGVAGAGYFTPFTFSLLVYPVVLSFFFIRNKMYRIIMSILLLAVVVGTHLLVEPPEHIYLTWATGMSPDGRFMGHANLLHLTSPAAGVISLVILGALTLGLLLLPILIWREQAAGRHQGWRQG